ncbi:hypothetical protein BASA83_008153 [Batrachochytrium salamandrivorans]|nr:hypothetical protein BASA83_008153 [Batrachochytrium salamandrivorans]
MKVSFVSILATVALFISTIQCTSYSLWSAERQSGRVTFIPYTKEQRESVMGNIDRMMKVWVSSDSKQSHYSGKANPYPDLDIFRETYVGMTHEQFNFDLTRIFNKMRDRHTLYYKAGPYGCFSVTTGLLFKFVDDSLGSSTPPKVRVVRIADTSEILNLIGNVLSTIDIGDELLTINGLSFDDWYDQNKFILGFGANDSGGHSRAFQYLEEIMGNSNILPEDDSITFQLRRLGGNQELYTVTIPYVSLSNDECWDLSSSLYKELTGIALPEIPAPTSLKQKRSVLGDGASVPGNNTLQRGDTDIHKRSYSESVDFKDTGINGLFWTIWKNGKRNMGVIRIESFVPVLKDTKKDTTFLFLILTIRELLVSQLKDTESVLFDIRGVYTNGMCYSACEIFAAHIQDHGIGTIFGEDETTGGGGASVLSSDDSYFTNRPLEYIADPFKKKLTGKNPSHKFYTRVTVSVRQLVRDGNYAGQLIEDNGVKSNVIVRPTINDILPGDKGVSAYDRIADYLGDVAKRKMDKNVYFISRTYNIATFEDLIGISFVISGVDEIIVVHQGEKLGREEGWNFNNGKWIIGDGVSDYSGYISSTVRVWLSAPVGSTISVSLDATVDTYEDRGHFSLDMMDDFGKVVPMLSSTSDDESAPYQSITGRNRVIKETYSFTTNSSGRPLCHSHIHSSRGSRTTPVPRAPTISRHHCLKATDRIATFNYWDVLADSATDDTDTDTGTDIHQLTSQFLESANAVADNLSLRLSPPATRSNRRLLSGATKRAILASNTARQAFIAAATHTNPDPVQCNTLRDEWSRLKAAATQLERVDGRKQWVKHADNLDRAVSDGRTDLVFSAARAMSGNSSRSAAVTPLYNSDGIVQYDPTSILRVMQGHYGSLAADTTGHSLDLQYWHDRQPIQVSRDTPPIRNSDILDQDFSWNQIAATLLQMSPRKAPGADGISTAFYQAALYMPANTQEGVPPTPFARALLRVCGQVFASATIPRAWLCAFIVSIDKKDGDPLNPGDKRGIAFINVGLKLVCKVLQMRIERFVETNNLLPYEQAGFCKREECVGQVVSLVDIIQRRQNAGLNTHVLFIDIRKAFDTVPVDALLWKLQNMGFPRRTLAFLKALYTSSSARARAGSLLSDPFPVQRGVRQGCPLSGLLFNLFINDILDGVAPITVPGLPRDTNPIRGLMYADDVAVFADSEQSLLAASTAIEQWANRGGG